MLNFPEESISSYNAGDESECEGDFWLDISDYDLLGI